MAKDSPRQAKETATSPPPNRRTELEIRRDHMKAINAHYRKHKTLDGMPGSVPALMIAKARGDLTPGPSGCTSNPCPRKPGTA
jgi:hypothetical protein